MFILGAIIFSSITYAYTYNAKQITYEPTDNTWNVNNVGDALDDIKSGFKPKFGTAQYTNSSGSQLTSRTASLDIAKGKYLY